MFKIQKGIEQYKEDGNNYDVEVCYLVNDEGKELSPSVQQIFDNDVFTITFETEEETEYFSEFPLEDFPSNATLKFDRLVEINGFGINFEISPFIEEANLYIEIVPSLPFWNEPYSFSEYQDEFWKVLSEQSILEQEFAPSNNKYKEFSMINIYTTQIFKTESIENSLSNYRYLFSQVHKITNERLKLNLAHNSINSLFDFPNDLKTSCEQYLLYFVRFLQDLGINATSDLKQEAGKVLFSVTPTDDVEALDKIREALAVYLKLPDSPIVYDDSFAAMRLQQQIENLQHSQKMAVREIRVNEKLVLAQSDMIREKNVTISQQQAVIEQKDKIIEKISSKSIMMDSAENKEELEEIYDGIKVGESKFLKEQIGIHFNPAKVIKTAVKNTFGKDEKKSVLGLNED